MALECRRPVTIDWAYDREFVLPEDVRADLSGTHIFVPEQFLNVANIGPALKHKTGCRVTEQMARARLGDPRFLQQAPHQG